jgi:hypothetical protein
MKTSKPALVTLSMALALAASVLGATPGAAQSEQPEPTATPIPIAPDGPAPAPVLDKQSPSSADIVTWIPSSGFLTLPANRQIGVAANSTIPFDTSFHKYVLFDANGVPQAAQNAGAVYSNGNQSVNLSLTVPPGTYTGIVFQVKDTNSSAIIESAKYNLARVQFLPIVYRNYDYPPTNVEQAEPNNGVCSATGPLRNGRTYNASFTSPSDLDDWYYIDVVPGGSVLVSSTSLPTPNQLQVYVISTFDCNAVAGMPGPTAKTDNLANSSITVSSPTYGRVYIRAVGVNGQTPSGAYTIKAESNPTTGLFEDNDNPCQATKVVSGSRYTTYVDDTYDFFEINVAQSGNIKIVIENYPVPSQVQLRSPQVNSNCDPVNSTTRIGDAAFIVSGRAEINAFLNPGIYYARMGPPNPIPGNSPAYNFTYTFTPGSVARGTDTCTAFRDCFGDSTGGKFTLYWRGMAANTQLQLSYTTERVGACPVATLPAGQTFSVGSSASGSREITGFGTGYIKVRVRAFENGVEVYTNEHPIKMNCNFLSSAAAVEESTPGPTPAP